MSERRKCFLWFAIRFTTYEILKKNEDYELVITKGWLSKKINRIKLYRVTDMDFERTLGNCICGVANINLVTTDPSSGSRQSSITIEKIKNAKEFEQELGDLVSAERKRVGVTYSETHIA